MGVVERVVWRWCNYSYSRSTIVSVDFFFKNQMKVMKKKKKCKKNNHKKAKKCKIKIKSKWEINISFPLKKSRYDRIDSENLSPV